MPGAPSSRSPELFAKTAAVAISATWLTMALAAIVLYFFFDPKGMETLGQTGDLFGSINALFTGVALVGLTYTIFEQRSQIAAEQERTAAEQKRIAIEIQERYWAARLNSEVAEIEACGQGLGFLTGNFTGRHYKRLLISHKECLARQRIGVLRFESLGDPRITRSRETALNAVAMYFLEVMNLEIGMHLKASTDFHLRSATEDKDRTAYDYLLYLNEMTNHILEEFVVIPFHGRDLWMEIYNASFPLALNISGMRLEMWGMIHIDAMDNIFPDEASRTAAATQGYRAINDTTTLPPGLTQTLCSRVTNEGIPNIAKRFADAMKSLRSSVAAYQINKDDHVAPSDGPQDEQPIS